MDTNVTAALVENRMRAMTDATVIDEATAQQALASALSAVGVMNQHFIAAQQSGPELAAPMGSIVTKLEKWIKRLVAKLTEIAMQLKASFSITVGTSVSVTVSCGPFG